MSRVQAFICFVLIAFTVSCSGGTPPSPVIHEGPVSLDVSKAVPDGNGSGTVVSDPVYIAGGNTITLTGLESGRLYTIYTGKSPSAQSRSSVVINDLGGGVYSFVLPEGMTEFRFSASEIGLGDGGCFSIGEVVPEPLTFQDGSEGMTIGQGVTDPVFTGPDGSEIYEAFFSVDMDSIPDPRNIVITEVLEHTGEGGGSHFYCFVDEYGREITSISPRACIDLSEYATVYIYLQMTVYYGRDMTDSLYLLNPKPIEKDKSFILESPATYIVGNTSPMCLVVERPEPGYGLGVFINDLNARYADTGERARGVLPVKATEDEIIVYISGHSRPVMFDYDGSSMSARLEPAGITVESIGRGTWPFTIEEGSFVYPIICAEGLSGCTLTMTTDIPDGRLKYTIINRDGDGYGQGMLSSGGSLEVESGRPLDWLFFLSDGEGGTFTVSIE